MKRDLSGIRDRLREDARCKRLKALFTELPIYQIPTEDLIKEVEQIHKARSIRFLTQASPRFIEAIVDASLMESANRSRCAEISMKCYKAEATLKDALEPLREYLLLTYGPDLSFVRTKDERLQVINMALAPFIKFMNRIALVRGLCDIVVKDIDQGAFTLQRSVAALNMRNGRGEQTI